PTVPVTALGAGAWGAWVVLAALPSSLDCPLQAPSRSPAITRGKASLRMRIPSGSAESAHRRRAGNATGRGSAAKGRDRDRPSTIPRLAQETSSDDSLEENTDIRNARGMKPAAQRPPAPLHSPILLLPEAKEKLTRRQAARDGQVASPLKLRYVPHTCARERCAAPAGFLCINGFMRPGRTGRKPSQFARSTQTPGSIPNESQNSGHRHLRGAVHDRWRMGAGQQCSAARSISVGAATRQAGEENPPSRRGDRFADSAGGNRNGVPGDHYHLQGHRNAGLQKRL